MMLRKIIPLILTGCAITTLSAAAAANVETVVLENATYCHITANGDPVYGYASHIGTFTEEGRDFSFISPGESGQVPLIKKDGKQYIIVDHSDAADQYTFDYTSDYKYILGYENEDTYCKHDKFPPCLILGKMNPCNSH